MFSPWRRLCAAPAAELDLTSTLTSGQAFRWRSAGEGRYAGVVGDHAVELRQDATGVEFRFCPATASPAAVTAILADYFNLGVSLQELYTAWSAGPMPIHQDFRAAAALIRGLRILRQPPEECLFSFLCSQNNNVKRIAGMIDRLAASYGTLIAQVGPQKFYTFPTVEVLARAKEDKLRRLGFGYRAKYIVAAAKEVLQRNAACGGASWLAGLRAGLLRPGIAGADSDADVVKQLTQLTGVGPKVADCVALFSLDRLSLVPPVDTHVWQMAVRHMSSLDGAASLTAKRYRTVADFFLAAFGPYCGWAHCILFAAALHAKELALSAPSAPAAAPPKSAPKAAKRPREAAEAPVRRKRAKPS